MKCRLFVDSFALSAGKFSEKNSIFSYLKIWSFISHWMDFKFYFSKLVLHIFFIVVLFHLICIYYVYFCSTNESKLMEFQARVISLSALKVTKHLKKMCVFNCTLSFIIMLVVCKIELDLSFLSYFIYMYVFSWIWWWICLQKSY